MPREATSHGAISKTSHKAETIRAGQTNSSSETTPISSRATSQDRVGVDKVTPTNNETQTGPITSNPGRPKTSHATRKDNHHKTALTNPTNSGHHETLTKDRVEVISKTAHNNRGSQGHRRIMVERINRQLRNKIVIKPPRNFGAVLLQSYS